MSMVSQGFGSSLLMQSLQAANISTQLGVPAMERKDDQYTSSGQQLSACRLSLRHE